MTKFRDRAFWAQYYALAKDAGIDESLKVTLPWDGRMNLELVVGESRKSLSLLDRATGTEHPLGWWDDARWHPFALRWGELQALVRDWSLRADVEPRAPVPLLLLSCFVGFGVDDEEERQRAAASIASALRALGCAADDAAALAVHALPDVGEDDYRWTPDPELGWVFGGEYPCYSLRNREHAGGDEGAFPFLEFRRRFMS